MKINWLKRIGLLTLALMLSLSLVGAQSSQAYAAPEIGVNICYVDWDATGANNGTSWTDAYTDLQSALGQPVTTCSVIWVAEGTYKPTATTNRSLKFNVKDTVAVLGGFVGGVSGETDPSQRVFDPVTGLPTYLTILSGDIGTPSVATDNSYHVIEMVGGGTLDGLVVADGYADGTTVNGFGGGLKNYCQTTTTSLLVITHSIFHYNYGKDGGGIYSGTYDGTTTPSVASSGCQLQVSYTLFDSNTAISGGGIEEELATTISYFDNVTFQNNIVTGGGGGVASANVTEFTNATFYNNSASGGGGMAANRKTTMTGVTFDTNTATGSGGGLYTFDNGSTAPAILTNVTFSNNHGASGGGFSATTGGAATLTNVIFNANASTSTDGGGMFVSKAGPTFVGGKFFNNNSAGDGGGLYTNAVTPKITGTIFDSNHANAGNGGGWYGLNSGSPALTGMVFKQNTASVNGGGIYLISGVSPTTSKPTITMTTFNDNVATGQGGGMYNSNAIPTLTNVTFYHNSAQDGGGMANFNKSSPVISFATFNANFVGNDGGAISNFDGGTNNYPSNPVITNSILWGNTVTNHPEITRQVYNHSDFGGQSLANITYSVVQNGYYPGYTQIITADPQLGTFGVYRNLGVDAPGTVPLIQANPASSAINVASTCVATDENNVPRPVGAVCDMGAYESGYLISGLILDSNANVVPDVILSYTDGTAKTAKTDAQGKYSFYVSYGFAGTVTPSKAGYIFDLPFHNYTSSPVSADLPNEDFTATYVGTSTISGTISPNTGTGTVVSYSSTNGGNSGTATFNTSTGAYSFQVTNGWSGTVSPAKTGYVFKPANRSYTNVSSNMTSQNFTPVRKLTITIGTGSGTVTGSSSAAGDPSVNCNAAIDPCAYDFTMNSTITLAATPAAGYVFSGWSGACTGTTTCKPVMSADKTVTANFTAIVTKTVTFYSVGAQDGQILETGENTTVGGTTELNSTATTMKLGDNSTKKQYRNILSFATGATLPDTAKITSVVLKVRAGTRAGSATPAMFQGFLIDVRKSFFGTTTGLQAGDFQATVGTTSYGKAGIGPFTPAVAASGGWYTFTLTTTAGPYVNKLSTYSGLTQFRLRFKLDDNGNAIANYLLLYTGNAALTYRPQLIIKYTQ